MVLDPNFLVNNSCQISFICLYTYDGSGHAHTLFRNPLPYGTSLGIPGGQSCQANPINTAVGNKIQVETDYLGSGPFPLQFVRTYNSKLGVRGSLDASWRHSYDRALQPIGSDRVMVTRPNGQSYAFRLSGSVWAPDSDIYDRLIQTASGWELKTPEDILETYDASGKLLSIANRAGLIQTMGYFASGPNTGLLETVTDPFGQTLTFTYTGSSNDSLKRVATMTNSAGGVYLYGYDSNPAMDRLVSVTYPDTQSPSRYTRTYHYNEPAYTGGQNIRNSLTGITDENGARFANFGYTVQSGYGEIAVMSQHAGGAGQISLSGFRSVTNGTELDVTYSIDTGLTLTRVFRNKTNFGKPLNVAINGPGPGCEHKDISYFANDSIQFTRDFNDNRINYERLDSTRPDLETKRVEGLTSAGAPTLSTRTISTQWHPVFRLPAVVAEPLRKTSYVYNGDGGVTCGLKSDGVTPVPGVLCSRTVQATTDVNGSAGLGATVTGSPRVWTYTYNANGQVLTEDGPRTDVADVTTYTYYANNATCPGASATGCRGQVQSITNAAGHGTTVTDYNAHGQPLSITDPNGLVTTLTYDARMRLTSRNVGGETTGYTYDNVGQLTRVTLPDTSYLEYVYDAAHRLTEIRDNLANKIVYTLDAMGNRTQEQVFDPTNQLKQTRSREYNNLNRLVKDIGGTSPTTQITQYGYDNQGNLTSVDGPLNNTTANDVRTYTYDALNRLATQVDPSGAVGGTTVYGYSGLDQLASVSDPRNLVTSYSYDGLNNLNQQLSPDTGATVNTFDAAGNILTSTDAKGQVTSYTYDALNRVASITYQGGVVHGYQYDQGTNGKGRLTQITEPNSVTQYGYDQKGRLTAETRTINAVAYTTGYGYDGFGRLASITYPSGRTVTYTLDSLGRIQQIATTKDSTTQTVVSGIAYRPFGPFQAFGFGNGQTHSRGFDQDGRIASYSLLNQSVPVQSLALGYDEASRIVQLSDTVTPANTNLYGYDSLDRLLNMTAPSSNQGYTYDAVGNRLTKTVGANSSTYAYAPTSNRLSAISGANPRSYAYDNNGSITGDSVNSFGYDTRGRLMQAVTAGGTTSYQVNSLGQRIRKTNTQGDTVFHYDAQGRLIAESGPGGAIRKEYLYLGDTPVAVIQ